MGRCYLALGELSRAVHVSNSLLRKSSCNADGHLIQAEARFQSIAEHIDQDAWKQGAESVLQAVRQALALDPESRAAASLRRRLRGHVELVRRVKAACAVEDWALAAQELSGALAGNSCSSSVPAQGCFAARCYAERARAKLQLSDFEGAVADCKAAAALDDRLVVAPVLQAQALQKLERWDEAVSVLEALYAWKRDEDIFWKVEWAKFEVRRVRRPDYYAVLGIQRTATQAEVKSAYRKMSIAMHPDKQLQQNPFADEVEAREKFQMIGEAFEILGTEAKREYYDKGYDAQGIRECLQVRKRFAGQAPCSQCGEDESGRLGSDLKWYCSLCWDRLNSASAGKSSRAGSAQSSQGLGSDVTSTSQREQTGHNGQMPESGSSVIGSSKPSPAAVPTSAEAKLAEGLDWSFSISRGWRDGPFALEQAVKQLLHGRPLELSSTVKKPEPVQYEQVV
eukprot:TRINITY_DN33734_c0_g1_i1.p1 TRINITY_DN33734_c0_g1~~TRINITY_DN33734_c0_g1_i1.p1  ORF type:complete len:501 (+),score=133.83 TRINITY_DN33734_c0_g1_i1:145-1503(+)